MNIFSLVSLFIPIPFVLAWLLVAFLDARLEHFTEQLDQAMDQADKTGGKPDFSAVRPPFSELDELLDRFKRLVGKS